MIQRRQTQPAVAGFEDRRGPHGMWAALGSLNSQETDSPLEAPEGTQPCQHLDFSSVRPMPGF